VEERASRRSTTSRIRPPENLALPLFAYGLLKPSEPGHRRIADLVGASETARAQGVALRIRNGLPLLVLGRDERVDGILLFPVPGSEAAFYDAVLAFEPASQYRRIGPVEVETASARPTANALWANRPDRGAEDFDGSWWTATDDPLLVEGLAVVRQDAERLLGDGWLIRLQESGAPPTPELLERFLRLQATYLLLWTITERAAAFIAGPDERAVARLGHLEELPEYPEAFAAARVVAGRPVTDVRNPGRLVGLRPDGQHALGGYWYTVRSTITHRGKAAFRDVELVALAVIGLHDVLRRLLPFLSPTITRAWTDREPEGVATCWSLRRLACCQYSESEG
jgi:hypothetical protein